MACALFSCSGGGSGLGANETLGELPSLYADFAVNKHDIYLRAKETPDMDDLIKLDKENKQLEDEFKAKRDAELEKIKGKEVKHSFSDALKSSDELFFDMPDKLTLMTGTGFSTCYVTGIPKTNQELAITPSNEPQYELYIKAVTSNGVPIGTSSVRPIKKQTATLAKGTALEEINFYFSLYQHLALLADFDQLVFCTKAEFDAANAQIESTPDEIAAKSK